MSGDFTFFATVPGPYSSGFVGGADSAKIEVPLWTEDDSTDSWLVIQFTDEGIIMDVIEDDVVIGTSSEMYAEVADRLTEA